MKKPIIAIIALVAVAALMLGLYFGLREQPEQGPKDITVTVVYQDGTSKDYSYRTEAEYLAQVLQETGLASGEQTQYGLFIQTVDGVTVDSAAGHWWKVRQNGQDAMVGAESLPVHQGDTFQLVYTCG